MKIIADNKEKLTSFEDIWHEVIQYREWNEFEYVKCRGVFTDGWLMPLGHLSTCWQLKKFLMSHGLEVYKPFGSTKKHF